MSRHGRRRSRSPHTHSTQRTPHLTLVRPAKDESAEMFESSQGLAMSIAANECSDDRPAAPASASETGGAPGLVLRARREARGASLDDISRTTKISKNVLRALENSDVLHLPAAIYTRGFVKAYAAEVGLNPDATADEYLRQIEPQRTAHVLVDDGQLPPLAEGPPPVDANGDARDLLAFNQVRRFSRLAFAIAAVGLVGYVASFNRGDDTVQLAGGEVSEATAVQGTANVSDAAQASVMTGPFRLELAPDAPCWVSVSADGERVLAKLLQPGDRETIEITDEAVVRVGEPGALSYSINGQSGRALGPAGQPVTIRITKENFRDFLSS